MGRRKIKGNMDIELAIDVLEMAEHLDHVILFSRDGDFHRLVEAVQRRGLRVSVVSTIKSSPPMVADELRRQADDFIELSELVEPIARNPLERGPWPAIAASNGCEADDTVAMRSRDQGSPRKSGGNPGSPAFDRLMPINATSQSPSRKRPAEGDRGACSRGHRGQREWTGGGDTAKSEEQSYAPRIGHEPEPAVRSANPEREALPRAGDAERPMPDERGIVARSAKG